MHGFGTSTAFFLTYHALELYLNERREENYCTRIITTHYIAVTHVGPESTISSSARFGYEGRRQNLRPSEPNLAVGKMVRVKNTLAFQRPRGQQESAVGKPITA